MRRIAVVQPTFSGGGAEAVCLHLMEALADDYKVSLLTLLPTDLSALDALYGTRVASRGIAIHASVPASLQRAVRGLLSIRPCHRTRQAWMMSAYRALGEAFDLPISTYNEMDFGVPGIQYVHSPGFVMRPREALRRNLTLTNSRWTAERITAIVGVEAHVVAPPVSTDWPQTPWAQRTERFVCVTRLSAEKRLESVVRIMAGIRQRGHEVELVIVSGGGKLFYRQWLRQMIRRHPWVKLAEQISRDQLVQLLSSSRYGLSARRDEPYGIGVAELMRAGCLPFVHRSGGATELVGNHPLLTWRDEAEAIEHAVRVIEDEALQDRLRRELDARSVQAKPACFHEEVRAHVGRWFAKRSRLV